MPKTDLEHRFLRSVQDIAPPKAGDTVVLGVSGGIDSMVLLHLFVRMNQAHNWGLHLHVAHLNHQLRRQDSDMDAQFVADQARGLRLAYTVESADAASRAKTQGISIELAARKCRYEFFERLCLKTGSRIVALAHHADDNVETILQRMIRGTGLRGLGGIRPVRPIRDGSDISLARPLLQVRHSLLATYARSQEIPFRQDASNDSLTHSRNRIRHELLPFVRERFNPQADDALLRLGEQARAIEAYLRETSTKMLESLIVDHNDRQIVLHGPSLARRPRVIQTQLIREVVLRMGTGEGEITFGHLNTVADLLDSEQGSKEVHLPGGLRVTRRYARLVFERADHVVAVHTSGEFCVSTSGRTLLPAFAMQIEAEMVPADEATVDAYLRRRSSREQECFEEWIDADAVHAPLVARARRSGDRFFPLGMPTMKKVSDLLIDEKIDASRREQIVILCDQFGPVWVVPLRIDQRVRLTRATRRILRLTAKPMTEGTPRSQV